MSGLNGGGHQVVDGQGLAPGVIVSVRDLRVHFQSKAGVVHAVDGLSFDIHDGETLGLVGETGCGKSVTARSFLGLVPSPPALPPQGSILFRHRATSGVRSGSSGQVTAGPQADPAAETIDLLTASDQQQGAIRGNRIAMIFQDPGKALNPALTVGDQVSEVFLTHRTDEILERAGLDGGTGDGGDGGNGGRPGVLVRRHAALRSRWPERGLLALPPLRNRRNAIRAAVKEMVVDALAETQIPNPVKLIDRYPHELSGGMKQRVMIAQALACNPDVLIADEPTTALDVTVQARIIELVEDLKTRHQTSVLYISHDLSLVRRVCDRIAVMYAGRIAEIGTADEVFNHPRHPYTRGLLAAIPSLTSERGHLEAIEGTVPELINPAPGCRFAGRCQHATKSCHVADPELITVGHDGESAGGAIGEGHVVSCLAYGGGGPDIERPIVEQHNAAAVGVAGP